MYDDGGADNVRIPPAICVLMSIEMYLPNRFRRRSSKVIPVMLAHSVVDVFCMKTEAMRLV